MKWVVKTEWPVQFVIQVADDLFNVNNETLLQFGNRNPGRRLIAIDQNLCASYLPTIDAYFRHHQVDHRIVPLSISEERKDLDNLTFLLSEMEQFGLLRRDEPVIGIGGGVLLDIVGMAASLYRRGVPYIKVPTTVVGLIDASVGAKTGINFKNRRNRLGTYYPPVAAYLDKSFLATLPRIEVSSGLGEVLKMAVVKDAKLFSLLERSGQELVNKKFISCTDADEVIERSIQGMKEELENNLWELNLARLVDFGHSFSPILEMRSIYDKRQTPLTHGQAVTLDVLFSCLLSQGRNWLPSTDVDRVFQVAEKMDLPTFHPLFTEPLLLMEALQDTMKHRNGAQNLPVPKNIGQSDFVNDLTFAEIKTAAQGLAQRSKKSTKTKGSAA